MDLHIDDDELNACVQCGLCLSSCPTYRVTGDETFSPRGRIALMRQVQLHDAPLTDEVLRSFETCVQCRACEPACPSVVPYGRLIEATRHTLATERKSTPRWQRLAFIPLSRPRLLRAGSVLLALAQRLHLVPKRFGISVRIPLRQEPLQSSGRDVYLFTGCVMDAWQRNVHQATQRVLEAAGFGVTPTGDLAPCCGALHSHAGMLETTRTLAENMMTALAPDVPIVVNSAGCGAAMKDYGHLLGTAEAEKFSQRVFDVQEFLAKYIDRLPTVSPIEARVAIQDPCHLRHVQRVHEATRTILRPFVSNLVELDDDGLCCGAGGAYAVLEPEMAGQIRDRKVQSISRAMPDIVASANPGCSMHLASAHLASAGIAVVHPMELVDQALRGNRDVSVFTKKPRSR
jgi:glycolate oxidase iron-sulfur subunit